jgi:hypothetical protein
MDEKISERRIHKMKSKLTKTFFLARDKDGYLGRHYALDSKKIKETSAHGRKVFFTNVEIEEDDFHRLTGFRLRLGEQVQAKIVIVKRCRI